MAVRSKAWVCGHSTDGNVCSKPGHGCLSLVFVVCCVGSGLCDEVTTRTQKFYQVFVCMCVCVCVCVCARVRVRVFV